MTNSGVWTNINIATMDPNVDSKYGEIMNGALVVRNGVFDWIGPTEELNDAMRASLPIYDGGGCWVTPGLIDCHTHIVYAGSRAGEFEKRLNGVSYADIANAGGGIVSTVKSTREATSQELYKFASQRLCQLLDEGVTTIEIKSGYGLDIDTELKMLTVARQLGAGDDLEVQTTFLGAHTVPPEYRGCSDEYIDFVCREALPAIAESGLADAVDGFCETIAFTREQTRKLFETACEYDFPLKLHAEQLSNLGGASLAAEFGAMSVDHVEYVDEQSVVDMAAAGTAAVLLPGAFYFLRETQRPPVEWFRKHGVPMALATDTNPGSSPVASIVLMLNMGCTLFQLTPDECLAGVTRHAAAALGLGRRLGTITIGKQADFVLWNIERPAELAYRIGHNPCAQVVKRGAIRPFVRR